jgi:hypothetical protein
MLDERGVEYVVDEEYGKKYPPEKRVTWSCDLAGEDMTVTARDYCIGINEDGSGEYCLDLEFHEVFTVEQAIAATLGTTDARPTQTESSGTCHVESSIIDTYEYNRWEYELSCGHTIIWEDSEPPRYCPECGRRIEQ